MTTRERVIAYGSAALLVLAGTLCAIVVGGTPGQVLAFVLIAFGLGGAVLLVFYEVGLSEDRERARVDGERRRAERAARAGTARSLRDASLGGRRLGDPRLRRARFRRRP